jgi:hypothetical protein
MGQKESAVVRSWDMMAACTYPQRTSSGSASLAGHAASHSRIKHVQVPMQRFGGTGNATGIGLESGSPVIGGRRYLSNFAVWR